MKKLIAIVLVIIIQLNMLINVSATGVLFSQVVTFQYTIVSYFGPRSYLGNHTGIDIAGSNINGKPIHAVESGVVIYSATTTGGYGKHIIIDHGDGMISIYGHASSLLATEGQSVNRGDVIAYVGSTGLSTGPHLHFEIQINGVAVNPLNYLYDNIILDPLNEPSISTDKTTYIIGEDVCFSSIPTNFLTYKITIRKQRTLFEEINLGTNNSYTKSFDEIGFYSAYITAYNSEGFRISSMIDFRVIGGILSKNNSLLQINRLDKAIKGINLKTNSLDLKNSLFSYDGTIQIVDKLNNEVLDRNVRTGDKIQVVDNGLNVIDELNAVITGDVSGDGDIDLNDLSLIREDLLEGEKLNGAYKSAGDLYGEGAITLNDLVGIMAHVSEASTIS